MEIGNRSLETTADFLPKFLYPQPVLPFWHKMVFGWLLIYQVPLYLTHHDSQCYLNAALHGDTQSVEEVARCFYYGIGIEKNIDVAEIWYQRAEELGIEPEYEENENN